MVWRNLVILLLLSSCADKFYEVQLEGYKTPREGFTELKKLGVVMDEDFAPEFSKKLFESLKQCRNFSEVDDIKTTINMSKANSKELKELFEKTIEKDAKARTSNGILALDLSVKRVKKRLEKSTAFRFLDRKNQDWFVNYGIPAKPELGYSNQFEMAPKRKIGRKSIYIRYADYEYKIRYALYNRVTGKVAVEGIADTASTLSVFSAKPAVARKDVQDVIIASLRNRIIDKVCERQQYKEFLYYFPSNTPAGLLINEGVDLAKQNRWKLAATKWENALAKESKNAVAHHNLGVYYEYIGDPIQAYPHYRREGRGKWASIVLQPRLERFLDEYQTPDFKKSFLPQIAFISAGNWVYIYANNNKLGINKKYPIFRVEMNRSETEQAVVGTHLREVGSIRVIREKNGFYVGRVRLSVVDYPILPGDFVIN
ncbi:hypothetical protein [Pseudobacteriovorax antillogorgiicola]|uniref:Tetratricopeptide repeat protein n=1 Tax=Pseudobacteriovorax antillogorgiicola TaxID=1513793 RepID=A0A1Y6CTC6_9BACT|nr:hypothetical protein [Pseudobacteriovorax antillogorgiicola]TCS44570.1 hypothetical protein EDD56_1323 [Pseudobacteriovorax antillogorgiicola]SMF77914.1 hypothetical protein SAMN06296036_1323 [Pseudobacteriovorax antillogorgiicola]